jgi:hypothetical protein
MYIITVKQTAEKGCAANHGFNDAYLVLRTKLEFDTLEDARKAANELAKHNSQATFQIFEYIEAYKCRIEKV